jgi:hypothetical protein
LQGQPCFSACRSAPSFKKGNEEALAALFSFGDKWALQLQIKSVVESAGPLSPHDSPCRRRGLSFYWFCVLFEMTFFPENSTWDEVLTGHFAISRPKKQKITAPPKDGFMDVAWGVSTITIRRLRARFFAHETLLF